ncbi:ORF66 [Leucania separata nucleopolyhedrovirus]|uniref:ORF66 n=1 Tax=Leucania separata nucleopolyhedrovirus TaxID=1307956 RepID=Q0IL53_NPVLS|nr:ORF66 [Leucania separata nucleopolyhedrovirus]AAR28830.1 ORF66 [Leucania separata nucleopolyhedrovirus]
MSSWSPTRPTSNVFVVFDKKIDLNDQTIACVTCPFVAPLSITFDDYQQLHDRYVSLTRVNCHSVVAEENNKGFCFDALYTRL